MFWCVFVCAHSNALKFTGERELFFVTIVTPLIMKMPFLSKQDHVVLIFFFRILNYCLCIHVCVCV